MQATPFPGVDKKTLPEHVKEMVDNPVPFDQDRMEQALEHPDIQQVRVYRLQKGMRVNVNGTMYKVISARENGKVTMKPV